MHTPLIAGFDFSAIGTTIATLLGGGTVGGVLMAALDRRAKREESNRQDHKEARKDEAVVETKKLEFEDSERVWYRNALAENDSKRERQAEELRTEMRQIRRTFGHEIRNLRQYNTALLDFYHAQYATLSMIVMQCRIMRARLKKIQKEDFDEAEFPEIDTTFFEPKNLPKMPAEIAGEEEVIEGKRKITGTVLLQPDLDRK